MTFGSWTLDSEPDGNAFGGFLLDVVELGRFNVNEEASSPHSRLGYVHLILLCWDIPNSAAGLASYVTRVTNFFDERDRYA